MASRYCGTLKSELNMKRDSIYTDPSTFPTPDQAKEPGQVPKFAFDERVVEVFDDMISRSVPLYQEVQVATAKLARHFIQPNSTIYDLGCSTGTTLIQLCREFVSSNVRIVAIDNSGPMIARCRERLAEHGIADRVTLIHDDIANLTIENASLVISNYTLQFIRPEERPAILSKIYDGLRPDGAFLLSEKVRHDHPVLQEALTDLHHGFKRANGYSELEIARKRDAIENVLVPLTSQENFELLRNAGFSNLEQFLKWYTFVSIAAIK